MGDLNVKGSNKKDGEIVGKFKLGTCKELREKWFQWCMVNDQVVANT